LDPPPDIWPEPVNGDRQPSGHRNSHDGDQAGYDQNEPLRNPHIVLPCRPAATKAAVRLAKGSYKGGEIPPRWRIGCEPPRQGRFDNSASPRIRRLLTGTPKLLAGSTQSKMQPPLGVSTPTESCAHAWHGRLFQSVESSVKDAHHSRDEAAIFLSNDIQFPLIKPEAVARETLIDANIAESDFLELHAALRALHKVEHALSLPFFSQELCLKLRGRFPPTFGFLAGKVLVFSHNTKQPLPCPPERLIAGWLNLVIVISEHSASFKH
jgi:hypothetical protein